MPDGLPDMKAFRERMQKWSQEIRERMQRRSNGVPGEKPQPNKPEKPGASKTKTFDI